MRSSITIVPKNDQRLIQVVSGEKSAIRVETQQENERRKKNVPSKSPNKNK